MLSAVKAMVAQVQAREAVVDSNSNALLLTHPYALQCLYTCFHTGLSHAVHYVFAKYAPEACM